MHETKTELVQIAHLEGRKINSDGLFKRCGRSKISNKKKFLRHLADHNKQKGILGYSKLYRGKFSFEKFSQLYKMLCPSPDLIQNTQVTVF